MKALVIAEKPSVARDIARVLKCGKKINGAIEGERYIVTWGLGHLVTLADPEDYDKKYKEWKMDVLPMKPVPFKLEVIKQTGKQFAAVKTQIHRKDVNEIIIATDAGREGELVARLILEKAGSKKPIKRLWISSVTDKAIREGFAKLKNGHEYDSLYDAAMCRAEADWLVGINATRALTCKYNAQLSCGRVQTPTLAMIAKREEKIRSFVPEGYYGMIAKGQNIMLTWQDQKSKSYRSFDKEKMTGLMKKLDGQKAVVEEIKKTPKKTYAPPLYDLTELQREANQRFGYSAKETLNIMQRLYENHKVLTYPRTDSRYLSKDIVPTIKDRLEACGTGPYRKLAMTAQKKDLSGKLAFVNDAKVSDHHAIIPTEQFVDLSHMTNEERKIYDLVVRRFLAVLYPSFEYEQTQIMVKVGGETFFASGKIVKAQGWRAAYEEEVYSDEDEEEEEAYESGKGLKGQTLPELEKEQGFIEIPIENLIEWDEPNGEGCIVSDKITKEGYKVGYMLREEPTEGNPDSGWRFMAGNEDDEYMDNPDNHHVFALNTICNYDSDIIPYLHAKIGSAFIRVDESHFEKYHEFKPMFIQKQ